MSLAAVIPAYQPSERLPALVRQLGDLEFAQIVVVNDGSDSSHAGLFAELARLPKVAVVRHAVNLGKGAALKTGINYAMSHVADLQGVATVDADGQHLLEDVRQVAAALARNPEALVLGVRELDRGVPFRSRLGNTATKLLFRLLLGRKLTDTQTGLRGIPRSFLPQLLRLELGGYEYELEMLMACKFTGRAIVEVGIQTVYLEGNASSHFHPLVDSMRIYFVLFRFLLALLSMAMLDYCGFCLAFSFGAGVAVSQFAARLPALLVGYLLVKKLVLSSRQKLPTSFFRHLLTAGVSGLISYLLIGAIVAVSSMPTLGAKALAEAIVFLAAFGIQRDFVFSARQPSPGRA